MLLKRKVELQEVQFVTSREQVLQEASQRVQVKFRTISSEAQRTQVVLEPTTQKY